MRIASLLVLLLLAPVQAEPLQVGLAKVDITPPIGYRMAGSYSEKFSEGVADPLHAKAIYLEQDATRFVLIVCDVCGIEREIALRIRMEIAKQLHMPLAHVCISATHTHCGPMHYDPVFIELFNKPEKHTLGNYPQRYEENCIEAALNARKSARPAIVEAATFDVPGLAFNRRFHMKDGSVRFNPGKKNPALVRPAGPVDNDFPCLLIKDAKSQQPIGMCCSFAMHVAVQGGAKFSADYPGVLQRELNKQFGPEFISIFAEGTAGDINHVNWQSAEPDNDAEAIGQKLAASISRKDFATVAARLGVKTGEVKAALRDDRSDDLAISQERLVGSLASKTPFLDQVEAYQVLLAHHMRRETGNKRPLLVQVLRVGPEAAIVTLPHEVFVELGLEIRKQSPFKHTMIVTIANDIDCYVPTRKAFSEGSYEVTNSPYKPGIGELLTEKALHLLRELR